MSLSGDNFTCHSLMNILSWASQPNRLAQVIDNAASILLNVDVLLLYIFIRLLLWQYFFINTRYFLDLVPHQIKITPLFYCLVFLELNGTSHLLANIKPMTSNMSRIGVNSLHRLYIFHKFYAYIISRAYFLVCFGKRWKLAHNLHFVTVVQLLYKYRHQ